MIDFKKQLWKNEITKKIDPVEIYDSLDRGSLTWPLRSSQKKVLESRFHENKDNKDLIVKLNTGTWKTLIWLLILQSRINSWQGRCLYVCPNKHLAEQTLLESIKFWIPAVIIWDNWLDDAFLEGKKIWITHVQKVFNWMSIFKLDTKSINVDTIILDDSHACMESIQNSFTTTIQKSHDLYKYLFDLFENDIKEQWEGTYLEIQQWNKDAYLPISYRSRIDKSSEIISEIIKYREDKCILFWWPLLKDNIKDFQAYIDWEKIEISPIIPLIDHFWTFSKARQRILMSATTHNDSFVIKWLWFDKDSIENALWDDSNKWSWEKMIIIPSLIDEDLDRTSMLSLLVPSNKKRSFGCISLVNSFSKWLDYKYFDTIIPDSNSISTSIKSLKNWEYEKTVVFVNRYDWIDLPDQACRLLILDWMPYFDSLSEKYEEDCRENSDIINTKFTQKVEQGLWRSVRWEKDYSAIVIIWNDLVKFIKSSKNTKYFSPQTRKQIEIWLNIVAMWKEDITEEWDKRKIIRNLLNILFSRDDWWKEFYKKNMDSIDENQNGNNISIILQLEYQAMSKFKKWDISETKNILQKIIDKHCNDECEKWRYLQILARYLYKTSKIDSLKFQKAAFEKNNNLLKPKEWIDYKRLKPIDGNRIQNIRHRIVKHNTYEETIIDVMGTLDNLSFWIGSEKFETALKDIWEFLWFASQRPDKEFKKWPDNLRCSSNHEFILFECKNEVLDKRPVISKNEAWQMNTHCARFEENYGKNRKVKNIMIIVTNKLDEKASFTHEVEIMKKNKISLLVKNILWFFKEFSKYDIKTLTDERIENAINQHNLRIDDLINKYSEKRFR